MTTQSYIGTELELLGKAGNWKAISPMIFVLHNFGTY